MTATVEVVIVRDPDGYDDVQVFVDGARTKSQDYVIDAGAGHTWPDWVTYRDQCLRLATGSAARAALIDAFTDPPGGRYVEEREDRHWLLGTAEEDS